MRMKSLKELRKHIEKSINNALENEVFETVRKTEIQHIRDDVLNVYSPKIYDRREFDGIDDPQNIVHKLIKNGTLEVENITQFNPGYETENHGLGLVKLIEYGHGTSGYFYDYPAPGGFTKSRPFVANTKEEIKQTKSHVKALKSGLKRNKIGTK